MRSARLCLFALLTVVITVGCSGLGISARGTQKAVTQYGFPGVNSVYLWRNSVISFGRFAGEHEVEIKQTVDVVEASLGGRDRVQFLLPVDASALARLDKTRAYLEAGAVEFGDALTRTLMNYLTMVDVELQVDVVLATEPGSYYSSRAAIKDRLLVSVLFPHPLDEEAVHDHDNDHDERGAGRWWAALSDLIAHELHHLHSSLMGLDRSRVDEEAAASLLGSCAAYRYGLSVGLFTEPIKHFDLAHGPEIKRYFPAIDEGELKPDLYELNKRLHSSLGGKVLSTGVLYLLAGSNEIHPVDDRDVFERIFNYCDDLAHGVPRFHAGEWQVSP